MENSHPASDVWQVKDLVRRAHSRDETAFRELYEQYSPRVFGYLFRHLGGNTPLAEDLTADVFTKVVEKIDTYEDRGAPFAAWLFRIARNRLIDYVRSTSKHSHVGIEEAETVRLSGSFKTLDQHLAADQIRSAMTRLTDEQRRVIALRFVEGRGVTETAGMIGKSAEAVKKLQSRGLASMKRRMECRSGCWKLNLETATS